MSPDPSTQRPPSPQPRWTLSLGITGLLASGLALLISYGGSTAGFLAEEKARVYFLVLLSMTCITAACLRLFVALHRAGLAEEDRTCLFLMVPTVVINGVSAYLCLTARTG